MSEIEDDLLLQIQAARLPPPEREYRFHPVRKWRVDMCYPGHSIAIEVEGGTWSGGRHTRGAGFEKDCEKYNELSLAGYSLYRFTSTMIKSGLAIETIERAFGRSIERVEAHECPDPQSRYPLGPMRGH